MRFWLSGPRILGGLVRPGVSFTPQEALTALGFAQPLNQQVTSGSFVYLAASDHGRVKVGVSTNPAARLAQLQTGSPFPVHFAYIGVTPGVGYDIERAAHQILSPYKCVGEWFNVPEEMAVAAVNAAAYRIGQKLLAVDAGQAAQIVQIALAQSSATRPPLFRSPPKLLVWFFIAVSSALYIWLMKTLF